MAKLKLAADPTFRASVGIPVAGAEPAMVEFTFKHRTRDGVVKWLDEDKDAGDVATVQAVAVGWDIDDEFTAENIERLCQNYAGAGYAIVAAYLEELRGARSKN